MSAGTKKIMIFDDDEDILTLCEMFLSPKGWEVYTYSSCDDPVNLVSTIIPDVILMDNWLPGIGGIAATQQLKSTESVKDIPVILFSANNAIDRLARESGANGIIAKPFDLDAFEAVLNATVR